MPVNNDKTEVSVLCQKENTDFQVEEYKLFFEIQKNNWSFFVKGIILYAAALGVLRGGPQKSDSLVRWQARWERWRDHGDEQEQAQAFFS